MIKFFLIMSRHGQARLVQYYGKRPCLKERQKLENEIIRQCISRNDNNAFTFQYNDIKIIYKRYLAIYCIAGIDDETNEFEVLSFFELYLQSLRECFGDITESIIIYNEAQSYAVLNEMIIDGEIVETSKPKIVDLINSIFPDKSK